jgi:hypothetical protein
VEEEEEEEEEEREREGIRRKDKGVFVLLL